MIIKDEITAGLEKAKSKHQEKLIKKAYKDCAKVIQQSAKRELKSVTKGASHKNWWNGRRLDSGIKVSQQRNISEGVKVHIMGDFRLKFFEMGTKERHTRNRSRLYKGLSHKVKGKTTTINRLKGHPTGKIEAKRFFNKAVESQTDEVLKSFKDTVGKIIDTKNLKIK